MLPFAVTEDYGYVSSSSFGILGPPGLPSSSLPSMILTHGIWGTAKLHIDELRTKKKSELLAKLNELKTELASLRVAQVTGGAPSKLAKMYLKLHILCCSSFSLQLFILSVLFFSFSFIA